MENCKFTTSRSVKRYKFLFVLAIFLSSFLSVYAEDVSNYVEEKTFTFSFENVPLKQVLSHIEKNSEFIFVYYGETINPNRKVSIKVTNQPIRPVLDKLFKGMSVEYTIDNRQITLKKVAQKKVQPQSSKRKTIQGFVLDKDEQPITGATIKIKDSTTGALTDIEGFYKLELEEENPVLIVSFMGYITQEVKDGKKSILNIQLEEELKRHKHLFMIVGMVNDKDIDGVLDLMPEKAFYFFTQASVQRAMPAEDFATKAIFHGLSGTICNSVQEAVEKALARAGQDDIIFIGGSTFVVADALPLFLKRDK